MIQQAIGKWYCQLVSQEQSDDEAENFGEHEELEPGRERKASKTEFVNTTLELFEDGRYALVSEGHSSSHGTWLAQGRGLTLTEAEDCTNGYEGLQWTTLDGERLSIGFKLNDDSHDGLDILVLTFGRTAPERTGPKPEGFIAQLIEIEDEDEFQDVLDKALRKKKEREDRALELWDAWVAGHFAADPDDENYWLQTSAFDHYQLEEVGGFGHRHARHALETLEFDRHRDMFQIVVNRLATLPTDDAADAELAPLLATAHGGKWLELLVRSRFVGGGLPDELYERPLLPQPETDDACRAYLAGPLVTFSRFEAIEALFPPGNADVAKVLIRYRGRNVLTTPLATIEARGLEDEALEATLSWLEEHQEKIPFVGASAGLSAMMFSILLLTRQGRELPSIVVESLQIEIKTSISGSLGDKGKTLMREAAAKLPEDQRAMVHKRFWLDKK